MNGLNFAIIGVLPRGVFGFDPGVTPDVMVPMNMVKIAAGSPTALQSRMIWASCSIVARIRPDVTDEQARSEADA